VSVLSVDRLDDKPVPNGKDLHAPGLAVGGDTDR
jgi:hypothetical protein